MRELTKEQKIELGYQSLFESTWIKYIEKVAETNNCSVNQIVKISNALPNVRKELEDNFKLLISDLGKKESA